MLNGRGVANFRGHELGTPNPTGTGLTLQRFFLASDVLRRMAMADDKSKRGSPDRDRIDVNDPDELRNWSKSLNRTPDEIKEAVRVVGNTAAKVREHFGPR